MQFYQVLPSIGLDNFYKNLRDGPFSSDIGIVNLHESEGTQRVAYINESFFGSYGCSLPQKQSKFILKQNGLCLYCEYNIQDVTSKRDSYCAAYCLYRTYLTKITEIDFKSAVLDLYYQTIS